MRKTRVIPVLLLDGVRSVKTRQFAEMTYIGDPLNIIRIFSEKSCDELLILDITATRRNAEPNLKFLKNLASQAFMPVGFGGNITSLKDAKIVFEAGMEKVVLGHAILTNPNLVEEITSEFGSQAVTACIDVENLQNDEIILRNNKTSSNNVYSFNDFIDYLNNLGVGEVIVQSVRNDSMRSGYDFYQINKFSDRIKVPLVALGGCNNISDMQKAVAAGASAVAAGTIFTLTEPHRAVLINYPLEFDLEKHLQ